MNAFVVKGHICQSGSPGAIEITENGYVVVEKGVSLGVFRELPERYSALPTEDFGDRLVLPGMCDLHLHAPQFSFRGLGMDRELLDWLQTYTFPEEAKYRELAYADKAYEIFVRRLRQSVTTRAAIFATVHVPATELLMEKLEQSGLQTFVGKVNMDRGCPAYLCEASAEQSARDTERWLRDTKERFTRTRPILTPRFIPTCSDVLLQRLGALQREYEVPVQSHLSENLQEIETVRQLCPEAEFYGDAYDRFGLFGGEQPCIMAHCVYSDARELERIKKNGVYIAHCPESNINIASGVAPVSEYLKSGLNVGLGTDVAGGSHESMLRAIMHAVQASKLRWRLQDQQVRPLTVDQAFYLATAGGGSFFGRVGRFEPGYEFDALVLDDSLLVHPQPLSVRARLERSVYLADERCNYAKYVSGRRLF